MGSQFWGAEVKAGEPIKVDAPEDDMFLHITHAALSDTTGKENEYVPLFLEAKGKKLVVGTLSSDKFPHTSLTLVLTHEFELSHNWKHGTVHFCGYYANMPTQEDESDEDEPVLPGKLMANDEKVKPVDGSEEGDSVEDKSDEDVLPINSGKPDTNNEEVKPAEADCCAVKVKVPFTVKCISKPKGIEEESDVSNSDDDSEDGSSESSDEDMQVRGSNENDSDEEDEDDDSDEESSDEEIEAPTKVGNEKKRPAESTSTSALNKKAKVVVPQTKRRR